MGEDEVWKNPWAASSNVASSALPPAVRRTGHRPLRGHPHRARQPPGASHLRTCHELARLRCRWPDGDTPRLAAKNVNAQLLQASYLLRHLETHGIALADLTPADIDRWLFAGAGTRRLSRSFVTFATRRGLAAAGLEVPVRRDGSTVTPLDDQQRWALARRLLHDDTLDPADRVVGSLIVLYAQPVTRIARLSPDDVHDQATPDHQPRQGPHPDPRTARWPAPPAALAMPDRPSGTVPDADRWLFPGRQAGLHIHPDYLRSRMTALGATRRAARHAAMLQLAREVPAAVLADILRIDVGTATACTARAGGTWQLYAAQTRSRDRHPILTALSTVLALAVSIQPPTRQPPTGSGAAGTSDTGCG